MSDDELLFRRLTDEEVEQIAKRIQEAVRQEEIDELKRMMEQKGPKDHIEGKRRRDLRDLL